ncbi:Holliday junction branch migration protein RuvA [Patescibacteria group bacterium]|nr:Holliday junction branch migration protein RuvA [Patescibacteria group bacterium]MDE1946610.1 Holliday junction branch migration protein RuvA [Patescibacteria group bacterium]MDE2010564.1 Holliday junction branch migration protein RuvA [Patescibacteria group bacterium]MDE2233152.1 Holliday junction branch migration protein RuvA [Patescibacteria group bacterium]
MMQASEIFKTMIATIKGKITELGSRSVIVDVGGIGYRIFVTDDAIHSIRLNSEVFLWTHLAVREDAQDLYGFMTKKERDFFELLITVSGIGPKTALNILSLISSDTLASAIRTSSSAHLVKVSGIGRKTAEKIILELKDRLGVFTDDGNGNLSADMSSDADALEALKALGYDFAEAREALKKIDKSISDTGLKVKAALKSLGK